MTIQVRESGALRFPALAMRGEAASAAEFDALNAEVVAAREGEVSLDAKLDIMESAAAATTAEVVEARQGESTLNARITPFFSEIVTARDGEASLDARLDNIEATIGDSASEAEFDALQAEVVTARSGAASLDARIDPIAASASAAEAELIAAREGEASLDAKLDTIETSVAAKADASRTVTRQGLVQGTGATLAENLTFDVVEADPAEVEPGSTSADVVTGRRLEHRVAPHEARTAGLDMGRQLLYTSEDRNALPPGKTGIDLAMRDQAMRILLALMKEDRRTLVELLRVQQGIELGNDALLDIAARHNVPFGIAVNGKQVISIREDGSQFLRGPKVRLGRNIIVHTGRHNVDFAFVRRQRADGTFKIIATIDDLAATGGESLAEADAQNRATAVADRAAIVNGHAQGLAAYLIFAEYGQSNANSSEGYPPVSTSIPAALHLYMLGGDVRPSNGDSAGFTPLGGAALNALASVVPNGSGGTMTAGEIAALAPGTVAPGETSMIAGVQVWRQLTNATRGEDTGPGHKAVLINGAVGGKNLAQLSKVNPVDGVDRYSRITGGVDGAMDLIEAIPATGEVVAIDFTGLEGDYLGEASSPGAAGTRAEVKAGLATLFNDFRADLPARTGQAYPPIMLFTSTGGPYARNVDDLGAVDPYVNMALWEFCRETPHAFLVGPYYHVTDKLNHLDANGQRWMGCKKGEVLHRVLTERRNWEPLAPLRCTRAGAVIRVDFATETQLRFRPFYRALDNSGGALEEVTLASKGFYVTNAAGALLTIASVVIREASIVEITLTAEPASPTLVWYTRDLGGAAGDGCGNLCNSKLIDPLLAYRYLAGSGMYAVANIPALVDEPYDLSDWCIPFMIPDDFTRS